MATNTHIIDSVADLVILEKEGTLDWVLKVSDLGGTDHPYSFAGTTLSFKVYKDSTDLKIDVTTPASAPSRPKGYTKIDLISASYGLEDNPGNGRLEIIGTDDMIFHLNFGDGAAAHANELYLKENGGVHEAWLA